MNSIIEVLYARRPIINYVTPSACENPLASSGIALLSIFLPALFTQIGQMGRPFIFGTAPGPFFLDWENFPGAICYNVYQVIDGQLVLLYECVAGGPVFVPPGDYVVTPVTPEGEGPPSPPNGTGTPNAPEPPEPPLGGNFGPCIGEWSEFSTTMIPNQVTTWFGTNTNFPPGVYKIEVELDSDFSADPPCVGVQFPSGYTAESDDGTNSALDPYIDQNCYATVEDMIAANPAPYYIFLHSGGKIGVNPNGNNGIKFSLHLQCESGGGGGGGGGADCDPNDTEMSGWELLEIIEPTSAAGGAELTFFTGFYPTGTYRIRYMGGAQVSDYLCSGGFQFPDHLDVRFTMVYSWRHDADGNAHQWGDGTGAGSACGASITEVQNTMCRQFEQVPHFGGAGDRRIGITAAAYLGGYPLSGITFGLYRAIP